MYSDTGLGIEFGIGFDLVEIMGADWPRRRYALY